MSGVVYLLSYTPQWREPGELHFNVEKMYLIRTIRYGTTEIEQIAPVFQPSLQ
jgi:hypothetical protein